MIISYLIVVWASCSKEVKQNFYVQPKTILVLQGRKKSATRKIRRIGLFHDRLTVRNIKWTRTKSFKISKSLSAWVVHFRKRPTMYASASDTQDCVWRRGGSQWTGKRWFKPPEMRGYCIGYSWSDNARLWLTWSPTAQLYRLWGGFKRRRHG